MSYARSVPRVVCHTLAQYRTWYSVVRSRSTTRTFQYNTSPGRTLAQYRTAHTRGHTATHRDLIPHTAHHPLAQYTTSRTRSVGSGAAFGSKMAAHVLLGTAIFQVRAGHGACFCCEINSKKALFWYRLHGACGILQLNSRKDARPRDQLEKDAWYILYQHEGQLHLNSRTWSPRRRLS